MRSHRLKPDLSDDDITEVIYRVSCLNEPVISVAHDLGITPEMILPWVNKYEAAPPPSPQFDLLT